MANGKLTAAAILGIYSGLFLLLGGILFRIDTLLGFDRNLAFIIITAVHLLPEFSVHIALIVGPVNIGLAIWIRDDPNRAQGLGVALIIVSVVAAIVGDEFWLGAGFGVVAGVLGIAAGRSSAPRATQT